MTTTGRDQSLAARVVVRVLDGAHNAIGAGFLIGPDQVATCAHVVAAALRADPYAATPPPGRLSLDFPLLVEGDSVGAVAADVLRWVPVGEDGSGDVAVLRLLDDPPEGCRMPPLRRVDQLWDRSFRVLGFPEGMADGVWSTGRFRGVQGTRWYQLQSVAGEQPVVEGFSGSPVWDEDSGAVVGMTVASDASGTTTTAYLIPIDQVLGVDPELLPCPYRGLEPFGEEHAAYFFGRDADIAQLADLVVRERLVAIAGPSGVGKSSLVRAGLLPRVRADGRQVVELQPVPGGSVVEALVAALGPYAREAPTSLDDRASVRELSLAVMADVVLVVDQFEELVAADPSAARELLKLVGDLVRADGPRGEQKLRAVFTLRSATLDDVAVPELAGLLRAGTFLLPAMDRAQLRDAIVTPAERAPGLSFETGLVDRILDEASGEPGGLPLVESLLTELWDRREGGYLTLHAYEQAGGVGGVVATHAEKVVAGFSDPDDEARLRRLFIALAAADRDGRFTRRRRRWDELAPDLQSLVQPLAAGRLLVVERATTGEHTVQLAHQALIDHWPRLHDWLTEDRDFVAWRDQLDQQRERWESAKRDDGALLRGTALAAAQDWLPERAADVSEPSRDYVQRSRARQRREVRRWRMVTAVLAVLVLVAGALAAVAVAQGNEVNEQLRLANAEIIAQAALARSTTDPVAATQLALAAWRLDPANAAARSALLRQYVAMRSVDAVVPGVASESVLNVTASTDGQVVSVRQGSNVVVLTDVMSGTPQRWNVPAVPATNTQWSEVSPDGRYLAVDAPDGVVLVWDIAARSGPRPVNGVDRPAVPTALGFTADSLLTWMTATGPSSFEVVVADPETGATVPHGLGAFSAPTFFNTTADPTIAVVSYGTPADGTSRVVARSLVDGTTVREFPPASAFVENGTLVVSCAEPATPPTAIVQRSDTGAEMARIRMLGDECTIGRLAAAVVDGGYLVEPRSTTRDKHYDVVRLTRLADGRSYDLTLPSDLNLDPANPITLTRSMTVVDRDDEPPTVVLSRGSSLLRLRPDTTPAGAATDHLALSRDGRYFVAIADDGTTVFERRSGAELATLRTDDLDEGQHLTSVGEGVGEVTRTDTAWYFTHYMLPTLDVSTRIVIPRLADTAPSTVAAVSDSEEGIMTFTDGVLSDFDSATGRLRSEPVLVSESAADQAWYRQNASFQARPGHPGEAVVLGRNEVQLWNLAQQPPQHRTLPARQGSAIYNVVFDPTGRTLAGLAVGNTVEIRDVDTGVLERPPFPIPASASAVGFNAEGHLVLHMGSGGENVFRLSFWDLATGSESASLVISTAHATAGVVADDGLTLLIDGVDGAIPFPLPLTAQQWFDRLCQLSDRPFTDAERAQLPAGASADPPCG